MPANLTPEYKAAEAAFPRTKREDRCARVVRPLDRRRDELAAEVATRRRGLSGGDLAARPSGCWR
jgi:hypothetical protein